MHELRVRGFDAIVVDAFWGYHSARPGAYDFTGIRDLDALFEDAARERLYVGVKSGPYSNGDADAGGLPDWLLAHTASDATLDARFSREARDWLRRVDRIIARHQLVDGRGTIVLDDVEPGALGGVRAFESEARRDGVTVPFGSLHATEAISGVEWGWTTAPNAYRVRSSGVAQTLPGSQTIRWRTHRDDDEVDPSFEDQAWPPLTSARRFDPDADDDDNGSGQKSTTAQPSGDRFFGVDDYGFHHGVVWYRGHFVATGSERTLTLSGASGENGALATWLDGRFLGSSVADAGGHIRGEFRIAPNALRRKRDNVIAIAFENTGHDADPRRDSPDAPERGIFSAALDSRTPIAWRLLGNGEYNVDAQRGPLADGGLAGEIAGWQYPEFDDSTWRSAEMPFEADRPGVAWYRAKVAVDSSALAGRALAVQLRLEGRARYRAFVFCNGWMMAHLAANGGDVRVVPIAGGILRDTGENTVAVALWTVSGTGRVEASFTAL